MDRTYQLIGKIILLAVALAFLWFLHPDLAMTPKLSGSIILGIIVSAFGILFLFEDIIIDFFKNIKKK